jgi:hypothetical protein
MPVTIKDLAVNMEVKNKGVEFEIRDNNNKHLGDLVVAKAGLTWCKGRTLPANGVKINWKKFIDLVAE